MRLERKLDLLFVTKVLTLPKVKAVPIKDITVREPKKPTHQFVPKIERRKQRRKTLIGQMNAEIYSSGGMNPKRAQRKLARKGITGVKLGRRRMR